MPLWVAVLMWLFFRTAPRRNEMVGLILGLTGVSAQSRAYDGTTAVTVAVFHDELPARSNACTAM